MPPEVASALRVEDLAGLLRGAGDALTDEVEVAGDVLEAGGGRGVGAEDADPLPCGLGELGVVPGAADHRLVPEVVVDEVALAAAFVVFPADEVQALEERDRFGDGRRADLEALGELGRGEAAGVGGVEADQHPGHHLGQARLHEDRGERLLVLADGLGVTSVGLRRRLRISGRGLPSPVSATLGGAVRQVGAVGDGTAVPHHLARDRRGGAVEASGDLGIGEAVGQPRRDLLAFLLGESASRHRGLLRGPRVSRT